MIASIDAERLTADLEELGRIGAGPDGGLERIGFTPADLEARDWVAERMRQLAPDVRTDHG